MYGGRAGLVYEVGISVLLLFQSSNPGLDAGSRQRQAMGDGGHESCQDPWRPETINSIDSMMRFADDASLKRS